MNYITPESPELEGLSDHELKCLLGGKGAGLVQMHRLGLPVPPFVVIPTTIWAAYTKSPVSTVKALKSDLKAITGYFKKKMGYAPLVSVRSGARVSCPGMMDTILNVGLDFDTIGGWEEKLGFDCAWDSYVRLVQMYGNVVWGVPREKLAMPESEDIDYSAVFDAYQETVGEEFPYSETQLLSAIVAVFKSWNNERAVTYRRLNSIPDEWGTAVTIQAMVFGNQNDQSATGVLFTRDPSSGELKITGEYLVNAQGEDVVAGIRTPEPLSKMQEWNPVVAAQLAETAVGLEKHFGDMQDIEFTIQDGKLYILQVRTGKRTARAAVQIATDMVDEGVITVEQACKRVTFQQWDTMTRPRISSSFNLPPTGVGIPASSGIATGVVVTSSTAAVLSKKPCVLVVKETTPDDIAGMNAAVGILTAIGGLTSHGAVVARSLDTVAVVGCTDLVSSDSGWSLNGVLVKEGDTITIDGSSGNIWVGVEVPVEDCSNDPLVQKFLGMVGQIDQSKALVTSDTESEIPHDAWVIVKSVDDLGKIPEKFSGYLDIRPCDDTMPESFKAVLKAGFPIELLVPASDAGKIAKVIQFCQEHPEASVIAGEDDVDALLKAGVKTVPVLQELASLLDFEGGTAVLQPPPVAGLMQKVVRLQQMAGLSVGYISAGFARVKGTTHFLSEHQRLREVLG